MYIIFSLIMDNFMTKYVIYSNLKNRVIISTLGIFVNKTGALKCRKDLAIVIIISLAILILLEVFNA